MKHKVRTWKEYTDILWNNLDGHPGNTVLYAKSGNPQDGRDSKIYYVFSNGQYLETSKYSEYSHKLKEEGLTLVHDFENDNLGYDAPYPYEYESLDDFLTLPNDKEVNLKIYEAILDNASGLALSKPSLSASFISAARYLEEFKKDIHPELNIYEHNKQFFNLAIKVYCEKCNYPEDYIKDFSDDVCRKFFEQTLGILYIWISLLPELNFYQKKFLQFLYIHDNRFFLNHKCESQHFNFPSWTKKILEKIESDQKLYKTLETINKCTPNVLSWDRHQLLTLVNENLSQIEELKEKCKTLQEQNDFLSKQNNELTKLIREHIDLMDKEVIPQIIEDIILGNIKKTSDNNIISNEDTNDDLEEKDALTRNENEEGNQVDAPTNIPQECYKIIRNVINQHINVGDKLLNTVVQMKKAAENISLEKPFVIALFLVVCKEVGAVKSDTGVTDFVRSLIGLGLKKYIDEDDINKVAKGVAAKINGGRNKIPLPSKHEYWESSKDMKIGDDIFKKLTT